MGFSSITSIVSGKDIMNVYTDQHEGIVLVMPDDTYITGNYDGYMRVLSKQHGEVDIFAVYEVARGFGSVEMYKEIRDNDPKRHEQLRSDGITKFYKEKRIIKALTQDEFMNMKDMPKYEEYHPSESAECQGYFGQGEAEGDYGKINK